MPDDPAHILKRLECQADFTYRMGPKTIKIQDTAKGTKSVADDLEAVLRKIEGWHQGSISGFLISYRNTDGSGIRSPGTARKRQGKKFHRNLKPMKPTFITMLLASSTLAVTTACAGVLDDWGKPALVKKFFMYYGIKFHQEGTHITSITLNRKGKESGNAYFHGGECYALMLAVARGPGNRVNFDKDVTITADNIWVDNVTGHRLKGNESEKIWRFEVEDKSGTPILTGELEDGSKFVITQVN